MTDFLQSVSHVLDVYEPIIPILERGLEKSGGSHIIDLASGGGGGWVKISERLSKSHPEHRVLFTDYFPNKVSLSSLSASSSHFDFHPASVDARKVPEELDGVRTQFLSLHHFRPDDVRLILKNALEDQKVLCVFEITERSLKGIVGVLFTPLMALIITPLIRPFSLIRLLLTYIMPILPLLILWDGVVSVFRTYSFKELKSIINTIPNHETYEWEMGVKTKCPGQVSYLLAFPKQ
jgi:hypothetical protein